MSSHAESNAAAADLTSLREIPLSYNNADSRASALRLIFALFPDWEADEGEIKFTRFTDGITNTLLKATKRKPGATEEEIDENAVLLRAFGKGTEILIDREKEQTSHLLLASRGLAPPLLARFKNGLLYRFIRGKPTSPEDFRHEPIWRGVAARLAQWHAVLPVEGTPETTTVQPTLKHNDHPNGHHTPSDSDDEQVPPSKSTIALDQTHTIAEINAISPPGKLTPNMWTVCQKWIFALPENSPALKEQKARLQTELERIVAELADYPGLGHQGFVLSHCDLLSGNVIIEPPFSSSSSSSSTTTTTTTTSDNKAPAKLTNGTAAANGSGVSGAAGTPDAQPVHFIDYEYTTPAPAAFDLANHFSEWGGFDCDHSVLPTRSVRRAFLRTYLASYFAHLPAESKLPRPASEEEVEEEVERLFEAVDRFRGIPGFFWGVWGLIQAEISMIDFDYDKYAEDRLGEYWGWREMEKGGELSVREKRWAEE